MPADKNVVAPSCASCRFAHELRSDIVECRRRSPTVLTGHDGLPAVWPRVALSDGCGEYVRDGAIPASAPRRFDESFIRDFFGMRRGGS